MSSQRRGVDSNNRGRLLCPAALRHQLEGLLQLVLCQFARRPICTPARFLAAMPARVRSINLACSSSATAAKSARMPRPIGVLASRLSVRSEILSRDDPGP